MPVLGLVAEGSYDVEGYSPLISKENPNGVHIVPRPCGKSVSGRFVSILRTLKYEQPAIDRAIVVSDAHGRDPEAWRDELRHQAENVVLPFPVEYVVIVQELEAILLCDPLAIASVCTERGNAIDLPALTRSPELFANPKEELVELLEAVVASATRALLQVRSQHDHRSNG